MIDVALGEIDMRPEFLQRGFEAFGRRDRAQRADEGVVQSGKWQLVARKNILKMERFMRAFDDFRGTIVAADALHEISITWAGILCDKDVAGAAEIARALPRRPSGEQEFVCAGGVPS